MLAYSSVASPGAVTVSSNAGEHSDIAASSIDPNHDLNRWFRALLNRTPDPSESYNVTLNFPGTDIDVDTDLSTGLVFHLDVNWIMRQVLNRTATSVEAGPIAGYGDFAYGLPLVGIVSVPDYAPLENEPLPSIRFVLSQPDSEEVSVAVTFSSGTATEGVDFTATPGTVFFPPGEVVADYTITLIDDALHENLELFTIVLSSPMNCTIDTPQVVVGIIDNDPAPVLSMPDVFTLEGDTTDTATRRRLRPSRTSRWIR